MSEQNSEKAEQVFTDFDGRPLAVGDRILPLGWGDGVRLVNASTWATVVGFGRSRVRVRFDGWAYGGKWGDFDSIGSNRRVYARKADHYLSSIPSGQEGAK